MTRSPGRPRPVRALVPRVSDGQSFKLVGLGGVGSIVARYAAIFLASLERDLRLVLVDGDAFEERNAARMAFARLGNKAEVLHQELAAPLARSRLALLAVPEYLSASSSRRLMCEGDIVLLCVDNNATRRLASERMKELENACLISGGNDGVGPDSGGHPRTGTFGNVQVHVRRSGRDVTPPITAFHPEVAEPGDRSPADPLSCTERMVSAPQILFANLAAASAVASALFLHLCGDLAHAEVAFDVREGRMSPVEMPWPVPEVDAKTRSRGRRSAARRD